jgi:nitroreductase
MALWTWWPGDPLPALDTSDDFTAGVLSVGADLTTLIGVGLAAGLAVGRATCGEAGRYRCGMDVFDVVRTVLAVRRYQDKPIAEDAVRRIIEAGQLTASSMNQQPWHFVVVQDRAALQELGKLVKTGPYIAEAAMAIAVAYEKSSRFGISDASRAIQSMILTAWDAGIGSNWAGFGGLEGVARYLGIPPELEVLAVVPFGYPAQAVGRGRKQRNPLGSVASRERYGQPFA